MRLIHSVQSRPSHQGPKVAHIRLQLTATFDTLCACRGSGFGLSDCLWRVIQPRGTPYNDIATVIQPSNIKVLMRSSCTLIFYQLHIFIAFAMLPKERAYEMRLLKRWQPIGITCSLPDIGCEFESPIVGDLRHDFWPRQHDALQFVSIHRAF